MGTLAKPKPFEPAARRSRSLILPVLAIGTSTAVVAVMLTTRAQFDDMIADFDISVPWFTNFALSPVLPSLLAVVTLVTVIKEGIGQMEPLVNNWNRVVIFLAT